jgi:hypothetical protein
MALGNSSREFTDKNVERYLKVKARQGIDAAEKA